MQDIGVFTSKVITSKELLEFLRRYASKQDQPLQQTETEIHLGHAPDAVYVSESTSPDAGYFSDEEKKRVESKLRAAVTNYVSIHFTSTESASKLARGLAEELCGQWVGIIDFSGAGGDLDSPPGAQ
jgi:hypothetical protein